MDSDHQSFFSSLDLDFPVQEANRPRVEDVELTGDAPLRPDLTDLRSLHALIQKTSRTTVLEFGCGWSSLILAASLASLKSQIGELDKFRRHNAFQCHSIDNMEEYIAIAKARIPEKLRQFVQFHHSPVAMTIWNGRYATEYQELPLLNPDLIYLDAPDPMSVQGDVNGWSTRHEDLMPMACDILKFEHFLTPKTVIVVDGRAANARFLQGNLQRHWDYKHCPDRDQHFFVLEEPPLGKYSAALIEKVYYRNGAWGVADL